MEANLVLLPGDGIGPEVLSAGIEILDTISEQFGHTFSTTEKPIGGCAIDEFGTALPEDTLSSCKASDAVLLGAVGGPKWSDPTAPIRPEQGLLGLRKGLGLYANLRPVHPHPALYAASPVREEKLKGVDLIVVRELTGGAYFGKPQTRRQVNGETQAVDTMSYLESEVRRVAHLAFQLARQRRSEVTSVDKANVLESSRLWRETVAKIAKEYPDVKLQNLLVDATSMYLIQQPASFDVILTTNLFGDILTDEASVLAGSMGLLQSASLGENQNRFGKPLGVYEPIHGSAPDIAGKNIANPLGTILSVALMLRHSLGLETESKAIEDAVWKALSEGYATVDIAKQGSPSLSTKEMTEVIANFIHNPME
jgi:3-isopropylmalate dehydrogenase